MTTLKMKETTRAWDLALSLFAAAAIGIDVIMLLDHVAGGKLFSFPSLGSEIIFKLTVHLLSSFFHWFLKSVLLKNLLKTN